MAKVGQHDSNGNFLRKEYIGMNIKADMNVGGNQIGYVYQEKTLVDPASLLQARAENGDRKIHSIATLQALRNSEIYGSSTTWDGNHTGYFCVKCPPTPKPCPAPSKCKKADPFNAPIGLGSDVIEARANLQDHNLGQVFREREATPVKATETESRVSTNLSPEEMEEDMGAGAVEAVEKPMKPLRGVKRGVKPGSKRGSYRTGRDKGDL